MTDTLRKITKQEIKTCQRTAAALYEKAEREGRTLTLVEESAAEAALEESGRLTQRLAGLPKAKKTPAVPKRATYGPNSRYSWIADAASQKVGTPFAGIDPHQARLRLAASNEEHRRHNARMADVKARIANKRGITFLGHDGLPVNHRDIDAVTSGSGAEFVPPAFMLDAYASAEYSAASFLSLADNVPLPGGTLQINVPKVTAGPTYSQAPAYAVENVPGAAQTLSTEFLTVDVLTTHAEIPLSNQLFDQGGSIVDTMLTRELAAWNAAFIEQQVFIGDGIGSGGDLPGLYDIVVTGGTNDIVDNTATPTPTTITESIGKAMAAVGKTRLRSAQAVFCSPARAAWLGSFVDTQADGPAWKLGTGAISKPPFEDDDIDVFGPVAGLPGFTSGALEIDAAARQDLIVVARPQDVMVLRSPPVLEFIQETYANQLTVLCRARQYWTFVCKHPAGFGTVYGIGTIRTAGW